MSKINWNYIKIIGLVVLVSFLFAFSNQRNKTRKVSEPKITFLGENKLFITDDNVSKLLIQNQEPVSQLPKDIIDLNELESALKSNPMIKTAEVFMSVNGELSAEIEQKRPIARVNTNESYYIDDEGGFMPLSYNYAARVMLVTGNIEKNDLKTVFEFAKAVDSDDFLKKHIIEVRQNDDKTIDFKIRKSDFTVHVGTLKNLEKKINNFKAFYQKALEDQILDDYARVNLKFDKQVICTKK
ncbi:cell division protein FtsQ [Winogradskyella epiphytica]|uniref:Cell division protein FtsQ n=1 Tax=Winogradskyella epiphytica TaxID=262005 RepID=A0A2V4Y1R4_9FLAO|nr:cell division protein FtsQ/DivIB [Winogradskyella epiphytica]PYE82764.1 cell division protein FtsQ [Winogradskyella epiphytica]GGW53432.1 cell division protein FtsQ [Winogradskyella epiphytica]